MGRRLIRQPRGECFKACATSGHPNGGRPRRPSGCPCKPSRRVRRRPRPGPFGGGEALRSRVAVSRLSGEKQASRSLGDLGRARVRRTRRVRRARRERSFLIRRILRGHGLFPAAQVPEASGAMGSRSGPRAVRGPGYPKRTFRGRASVRESHARDGTHELDVTLASDSDRAPLLRSDQGLPDARTLSLPGTGSSRQRLEDDAPDPTSRPRASGTPPQAAAPIHRVSVRRAGPPIPAGTA